MKNQHAQVTTCSIGGLKLDERLLALIVTWILTPRGSNHSVLTEEDLVYIFCITNKIKINWIHIIKEHMQKATRLGDYHYPYAVLVSKFLLYFEVNLEDETSELVKSTQELNNGSLNKMGFTKVGGKWISKDGDHGGSSSGATNLEQDEPADMDVQQEDPPDHTKLSILCAVIWATGSASIHLVKYSIATTKYFICLTANGKGPRMSIPQV